MYRVKDEKMVLKEENVINFLNKTGFILEMEAAEVLKKFGYAVELSEYFLDLETSKKREIDIIAKKQINKIQVNLIIECKQSLKDGWIFICSKKNAPRYYYAVKHTPRIFDLKKSKLFNHLHMFDYKLQLTQNSIILDKITEKKSDSIQIEKCLEKLPKALFDIASKNDKEQKNLYFPVALFSGQIFTANYDKALIVKEEDIVLYSLNFGSKFYKNKPGNRLLDVEKSLDESLYKFDDLTNPIYELKKIIDVAVGMMGKFQIDFVSKKGLEDYLEIIDKEVKLISAKKWSYNIKPFLPKTSPSR